MKSADSAGTCLVNGAPVNQLPVNDRGLAYGDGVFETMRVVGGGIPLEDYHFSRLENGLRRLRIKQEMAPIKAQAQQLAEQAAEGVIKVIVTRGAGQRGYALPPASSATLIFQTSSLPQYPGERADRGVMLFPCATRLAIQPLLAGVKHLNRLEQVLARSEWDDPAYAEGLVCDTEGFPIECTMSNLFIRSDGAWVTPDLSRCGVKGVMRDYLIDTLHGAGQQTCQRPIALDELMEAEEVFCCNSIYGVWPVTGFMEKCWAVGPSTRDVQAMAQQVLM